MCCGFLSLLRSHLLYSLFFSCYGDLRDLHVLTLSFPSRRSSDLILEHAPAVTMRAAAHATGISEDSVVKAVLLEDEDGYVLVAVPASCHVQLGKVARLLKHPEIGRAHV